MIEKIIIGIIGIFLGMMISALLQIAGEDSGERYREDDEYSSNEKNRSE